MLDHFDALSETGGGDGKKLDVLLKNSFGRSALTEEYASGDAKTVEVLLNHDSAEEEWLIGGLKGEEVSAEDADASEGGAGGDLGIIHEFVFSTGLDDATTTALGIESGERENKLGRSWGRKIPQDRRFVYADSGRPRAGEDSVVVTVADGTTVNVKLSRDRSATKEGEGSDAKGKECPLEIPLEEFVRRADVLRKRAIKRKVEREGRSSKRSKVADVEEARGH